jgi:hypothetical protein
MPLTARAICRRGGERYSAQTQNARRSQLSRDVNDDHCLGPVLVAADTIYVQADVEGDDGR